MYIPLPTSRMLEHAVPLGHDRFSVCGRDDGKVDEADADQKPDFTVFLTWPCLSVDRMRFFLFLRFLLALMLFEVDA
ncbi:unnamed protein product [Ectocarpus sp. 8 AP-2014]